MTPPLGAGRPRGSRIAGGVFIGGDGGGVRHVARAGVAQVFVDLGLDFRIHFDVLFHQLRRRGALLVLGVGISAGEQEAADDFRGVDHVGRGGVMQRRAPGGIPCVYLGSGGQESDKVVRFLEVRGFVQRCAALVVGNVHVGAGFDQLSQHFGVTGSSHEILPKVLPAGGQNQRGVALLVAGIDVCSGSNELAGHFTVAVAACCEQDGPAGTPVPLRYGGSGFDEQADELGASPHGDLVAEGLSPGGARSGSQQGAGDFGVLRCVQRRQSLVHAGVEVGPGRGEGADDFGIGRDVQGAQAAVNRSGRTILYFIGHDEVVAACGSGVCPRGQQGAHVPGLAVLGGPIQGRYEAAGLLRLVQEDVDGARLCLVGGGGFARLLLRAEATDEHGGAEEGEGWGDVHG